MQQPPLPPQQPPFTTSSNRNGAALQYGLLFGGLIGLIDILYTYYLDTANPSWLTTITQPLLSLPLALFEIIVNLIISIPLYIILFVFFLLAGMLAVRKSRQTVSGLVAGVLVGGIFLLVDLLIANILMSFLLIAPHISPNNYLTSFENSAFITSITYSFVAGLIMIGIGALLGWLGGTIGKGGNTPNPYYTPYGPSSYPIPQNPNAPSFYPTPQNPMQVNPYGPPGQRWQPGQEPPQPPPPTSGQ